MTQAIYSFCFRWIEGGRVIFRYYGCFRFFCIDLLLTMSYFFKNPYRVNQEWISKQGMPDSYLYGETPLTTLDQIATRCRILRHDVVFDLGCGPGRTTFWLQCFIGCRVIGIDILSLYIQRAQRIKRWMGVEKLAFHTQNFLECDFSQATVVYLFGTCLSDEEATSVAKALTKVAPGTKVISVSYPLTDYGVSQEFKVAHQFTACFPWGKTEVYLQMRLPLQN